MRRLNPEKIFTRPTFNIVDDLGLEPGARRVAGPDARPDWVEHGTDRLLHEWGAVRGMLDSSVFSRCALRALSLESLHCNCS